MGTGLVPKKSVGDRAPRGVCASKQRNVHLIVSTLANWLSCRQGLAQMATKKRGVSKGARKVAIYLPRKISDFHLGCRSKKKKRPSDHEWIICMCVSVRYGENFSVKVRRGKGRAGGKKKFRPFFVCVLGKLAYRDGNTGLGKTAVVVPFGWVWLDPRGEKDNPWRERSNSWMLYLGSFSTFLESSTGAQHRRFRVHGSSSKDGHQQTLDHKIALI
ncbi:hypothetical protein V8C35DRAFT_98966 [Trichoderma chlorosporum]